MIKLLFLTLVLTSTVALSDDHKFLDKLDIGGYVGYRHMFSSINASPVDSYPELGLILNLDASDNWSAFIQLNVNENAIDQSLEHSVIYGFLSYTNTILNVPFNINVGKLRHEMGLYNANIVNPSTRRAVVLHLRVYIGIIWLQR